LRHNATPEAHQSKGYCKNLSDPNFREPLPPTFLSFHQEVVVLLLQRRPTTTKTSLKEEEHASRQSFFFYRIEVDEQHKNQCSSTTSKVKLPKGILQEGSQNPILANA
jgi:hypothetical protein